MSLSITNKVRATYWLILLNIIASYVILYPLVSGESIINAPIAALFAHMALLAQIALVSLLLGLVVIIASIVIGFSGFFVLLSTLLYGFLQCFLVVDVRIYALFKFHFNGLALNVLLTPDGFASMQMPNSQIIMGAVILLAIFIAEFLATKVIIKYFLKYVSIASYKKKWVYLTTFTLLINVLEKSAFAMADAYNVSAITKNAKLIPFYQPVHIRRALEEKFAITGDSKNSAFAHTQQLLYPLFPITAKVKTEAPNILWIVLDGWRADLLQAQITPNMYEFAQKSQNFTNHWSGGNSTRFGIFTMFYGVYGNYWNRFLSESRSPVIIDKLQQANYDFKILSATSLRYPEFRRTVFTNVLNSISDNPAGNKWHEKDKSLVTEFDNFLESRTGNNKFMSFIFFDSSHLPFSYPDSSRKFTPDVQELSYLKVNTHAEVSGDFNKYKNALFYDDSLFKEVIASLNKHNLSDNTVVIITSDHGQEFYEKGHYGHSSAFTPEQTHVPLIVYVPKMQAKTYNHITEHYDIVPTLFELLGINDNADNYSLGKSLFNTNTRDFVVSCGFSDCGLMDKQGWLVFGTESYMSFQFDAYNSEYGLLANTKEAINNRMPLITKFLQNTSRFVKQ